MHDLNDERNILDHSVAFSPELVGKECMCCNKALLYKHFRADSSRRDGRSDQCLQCESSPRLSTTEHTARLREMNDNSFGVKRQQLEHQEDYQVGGREGRRMHHTEFIHRLRQCVPNLFVTEGRVIGDLALYQIFPGPQRELDGMSFKYLGYLPMGMITEFDQYEFDARNIPTKQVRGWRTPLLRFIRSGFLTEEKCNQIFGRPTECPASTVWFRKLYEYRNQTSAN